MHPKNKLRHDFSIMVFLLHAFYINNTFASNARLKLAKIKQKLRGL